MTGEPISKHDARHEGRVDKAAEDSFPASDPPSHSVVTGVASDPDQITDATGEGRRQRPTAGSDDAKPKGSPTSDRYATEAAQGGTDEQAR